MPEMHVDLDHSNWAGGARWRRNVKQEQLNVYCVLTTSPCESSKRLEELKESYEEKLENKFEMYKEAIKKHAYMCAMEKIEEHYVPVEEFIAEQAKVEVRLCLQVSILLAFFLNHRWEFL